MKGLKKLFTTIIVLLILGLFIVGLALIGAVSGEETEFLKGFNLGLIQDAILRIVLFATGVAMVYSIRYPWGILKKMYPQNIYDS